MLFAVGQMVGKLRQVIAGQRAVVEAANRGDFAARVDTAGMQGFQKEMGDGLNQLVATTGASIADVVRVMSALAEGDLTTRIDKDYQGAFARAEGLFERHDGQAGPGGRRSQRQRRSRWPRRRKKSARPRSRCRRRPASRPPASRRPAPRWSR